MNRRKFFQTIPTAIVAAKAPSAIAAAPRNELEVGLFHKRWETNYVGYVRQIIPGVPGKKIWFPEFQGERTLVTHFKVFDLASGKVVFEGRLEPTIMLVSGVTPVLEIKVD